MNRKFGVELEITGLEVSGAVTVLQGTGVPYSNDTRYRHSDYNVWKVTTDASVVGGCEVVSRVLSGSDGLTELKNVCRALVVAGATVNASCGLHVHIDVSDLTGHNIRNIINRYARFETEIDKFMPLSRRGNCNTYIKSMIPVIRSLNSCGTSHSWHSDSATDVCNAWSDRHVKLNTQSFIRQRTIEFRHHSGTINGDKIVNWIQFIQEFIKNSVETTVYPREPNVEVRVVNTPAPACATPINQSLYDTVYTRSRNRYQLNYSERKILQKLCENNYCYFSKTTLAAYARIHVNSVPAYISRIRTLMNVTIKNSRSAGYRLEWSETNATNTNVSVTTATNARQTIPNYVIINNDQLWNGISPEIRSFYLERTMEFGN